MTIYLDDRAGSKDLAPVLPKTKTTLCRLEFGDVMLAGHGPQGAVAIGIEHKTVGDVLNCIMDGRFASHQLLGMLNMYDYSYLIVEGRVRPDQYKLLWWYHETKKKWIQPYGGSQRKPISMEAWEQWLNSMIIQGGIIIKHTENKKQSGTYINSLHKWWNKDWDDHKSLKVFNESQRGHVTLTTVPTRRLMAAQLPGVGWEKSKAIAKHFPTVLDMCVATEKDWQKVEGIGKKLASKIVQELQG